ncbi:alcohol dehydrogenase [Trinickia symbiotica]|uniref:Alcohol dehydrogenase n=1 Tax=Trinickia symbiotica TaxID=863227 RepID=A0A2T3XR99_9BURK|nr:alcohol dehydrogenase family protein [Trinickia symbiotica]PTB19043.1 alcohol dehydrogenase [Trinickia symbiotica]
MNIPRTMRAVVLTGHGGLEKLEYHEDIPTPRPGKGEVLIRVGACGVNNTDLNTRTGWYSPNVRSGMTEEIGSKGIDPDTADLGNWDRSSLAFPRIQGAAIAGRIVDVGEGVDAERIGDRVMVDPVIRDPSAPLREEGVRFVGSECDGGYAEYAAIPVENAFTVTADISYIEMATFPCAFTTAEEMLERARLKAGEVVLVTGAAGGVGSANVQLAKRRGCVVIAIAGQGKRRKILELGADYFIPRESVDIVGEVEKIVGSRGVDVVADVVGGDSITGLLRVLKRGGRYSTGGAIAGPISEVDLRDLIYKDLEMYGIANPVAHTTRNLVQYIENGEIKAMVDKTFPLAQLREAQAEFMKKSHVGKIVIDVDASA